MTVYSLVLVNNITESLLLDDFCHYQSPNGQRQWGYNPRTRPLQKSEISEILPSILVNRQLVSRKLKGSNHFLGTLSNVREGKISID